MASSSDLWRVAALLGLLPLLGCAGQGPSGPASTPSERPAGLDLRYANVVDVQIEALDGNRYRFSVTLHHDDESEAPAYADAWRVEDLDGNVLGTRELLHSHSSQPFTRSDVIEIPEGLETVIVRGHDQTHGFGGQIMRVELRTGDTTALEAESGGG